MWVYSLLKVAWISYSVHPHDAPKAYVDKQRPAKPPLPALEGHAAKEDLEALRAYREYREMRKAAGWRPRRFDDEKGICKDLMGEWLGSTPGDNLG